MNKNYQRVSFRNKLPCCAITGRMVIIYGYLLLLFTPATVQAQRDLLFKKDSTSIRCQLLKATGKVYKYAFIDSGNNVVQAQIFKNLVDSIQYNKYDSNLVVNKLFKKAAVASISGDIVKAYQYTVSIGLNLGNVMEFNSSSGPDKKSFSAAAAIDFGMDYFKEGSRFAMTNELHWTFACEKNSLTGSSHLQRVTDELATLHDFSVAMNKTNKWNFNLIAKTNTSIFTIFDGSYFTNVTSNGKIQSFLNPYEITLSPGIKFQPDNNFRFSLSPYSVRLYGLTNQQIANTGFYTHTVDVNNNKVLFEYKPLGATLNVWYDKKVKKWLEMQYRLEISGDYFSDIAKNGLMNGLFITKIKIIKNVYLSHRAILKADFTNKPFKPFYNQTILLSYDRTF